MALKPPGPEPAKVHDVDDAHADRFHGQKKDEAHAAEEKKRATVPKVKTYLEQELRRPEADPAAKKRSAERVERRTGDRRRDGSEQRGQDEPEEPGVTAGRLAFDDNHKRRAQEMGLDGSPSIHEIVGGFGSEAPGSSLGEMLPRLRHPDLPELEVEPPRFLAPLQAMEDIYMRTRGRVSRRTKEILTSPDLEDLIALMHRLFDDATLVKKSEARHLRSILDPIGKDTGPVLTGFSDPRLTELWRLFVEGWDIWVPEGKETGVDLFWEGEAENDEGDVVPILQSLQFRDGEATLTAEVGGAKDKITFDGTAFYRLKHDVE
jgi:hypothetical protein